MLRRTLIAVLLAASAAAALAGSKLEKPPSPAVLQPTEQELKRVTEDVQKAVADKNDELLAKAIEQMETLRHDSFVPYIRDGMKSPSKAVLAASIRAAATHDLKDLEKDIRKLLRAKPPKKDKDPTGMAGEVGSAAIDYLGRLGITGEESVVLDDYLVPLLAISGDNEPRIRASWSRDLARASISYLGKAKFKRSVPALIDMVPEPAPKPFNPDRGDPNPPATYFEARVKFWQASEGWARWALKEITGKEFRSYREWEAWLKENKKDFK